MEQTTSPGQDQPVPPAPAPRDGGFFDSVRRTGLVRTRDRWVGGVAGGIARRFGIDPLLVRGILVVTVLLGGAALVVYGVAWALLPEEADGRIHVQETVRGRFDAALLGALAAVIIGLNRGAGWNGWWWDDRGFGWINGLLWAAATVAVVVMVVSAMGNRDRTGRTDGAAWAPAPGPATAWPGGPGAATPWAGAPGTATSAATSATSSGRTSARSVPHPGYGAVPATAPGGAHGPAAGGPPVPPPPMAAAAPPATGTTPPPPPPAPLPASASGPGAAGAGAPGTPGGWAGGDWSGGAGGGWSGGGTGGGTGGGWSGAPAPLPPAPRKPRVQGPGVGAVGAVVGLTLLALAGLLVVEREGELGQPVVLTALGIGIVLAGLGIIISGLRGRSSGTLGFLAIAGMVAAVPVSVASVHEDRFFVGDGDRISIADGSTWRPQSVAEARQGVSASFGDVDIDLTDVPLGDGTLTVPISLGAGDLRVVVHDDISITGEIALTAGQVVWDIDGESRTAGLSGGGPERYTSDEAADGDPVELALEITAGAGDVRVQEENR